MMRMETIKESQKVKGKRQKSKTEAQRPKAARQAERGFSLISILAMMTIFAIALLAVAPSVVQDVQREKELESIRRGEDVAEAIRQYIEYYQGSKLPDSIDDLLEGLPQGTKKRMILRPSSAVDPLSEDGKWRLVKPDSQAFLNFGRRVQIYNNGVLPASPSKLLDKYALPLVNIINTQSETDLAEASEEEIEDVTEGVSFIGVASQSRNKSVIAYYGIENHSKWIFTPLFRGAGASALNPKNVEDVKSEDR
jgi:type II secretory pathway pseudopilin PulG